MKSFTIYDQSTGAIRRSGHCPEAMLGLQVHSGESILVGQALCDIRHFIERDAEGRKLVRKHPPEVIAQRAPEGWQPPIDAEQAELVAKGLHPALAARYARRRRDRASAMPVPGITSAVADPPPP
ncbi:MAG TPA: hypothetical protein VKC51_11695 [Lacunisphaera sp.]|nr:hypothetical protein [Lacunisphaera sp.]